MSTSLTCVEDVLHMATQVPGGKFLLDPASSPRFTEQERWSNAFMVATAYAPLLLAIRHFSPEHLGGKSSNIVVGGKVASLANNNGRLLSLFSRVFTDNRQALITTLCSEERLPKSLHIMPPIRAQPIQRVQPKPWGTHLAKMKQPLDLLVLLPGLDHSWLPDLGKKLAAPELPGVPVLIGVSTLLQARALSDLMILYGHSVTEPKVFTCKPESPVAARRYQHVWLRVDPVTGDQLLTPDPEAVTPLVEGVLLAQSLINDMPDDTLERRLNELAMPVQVEVDEQGVRTCLQFLNNYYVDISTGEWLTLVKTRDDGQIRTVDLGVVLSEETMKQFPPEGSGSTPEDERYQRYLWMTRAFLEFDRELEKIEKGFEELPDDGSEASTPVQLSEETEAQKASAQTDIPSVAVVEEEVTQPPGPLPEHRQDSVVIPQIPQGIGAVPVLALAVTLGRPGRDDTEHDYEKARIQILAWLDSKGFPVHDPDRGCHLETPDGELVLETDPQHRVWSLRFDDRRSMAQGAFWRVEVTILGAHVAAMGMRLVQVRSTADAPAPTETGVPGLARLISNEVGLIDDGFVLKPDAIRYHGIRANLALQRRLNVPERTQSVIVVWGQVDASAGRLAARLLGIAQVICIEGNQAGEPLRPDNSAGTIHFYPPARKGELKPQSIMSWPLKGRQIPKAVVNEIFGYACAYSLDHEDLEDRVPSFQQVRQLLLNSRMSDSEGRLQQLRSEMDNIASSREDQIVKLKALCQELESSLQQYQEQVQDRENTITELKNALSSIRQERNELRGQLRQVRQQYQQQWDVPAEDDTQKEVYYPDTWDDLEEWVQAYGLGRIELLPSAAKTARESPFRDIPLAYKALDYLARYYVPMRTRDPDDPQPRKDSEEALAQFGLTLSGTGEALNNHRYKHEYRRTYRGVEIELDMHLKSGSSFDPASIFRMYFWYDQDAQLVLVGHFPGHLTNTLTR